MALHPLAGNHPIHPHQAPPSHRPATHLPCHPCASASKSHPHYRLTPLLFSSSFQPLPHTPLLLQYPNCLYNHSAIGFQARSSRHWDCRPHPQSDYYPYQAPQSSRLLNQTLHHRHSLPAHNQISPDSLNRLPPPAQSRSLHSQPDQNFPSQTRRILLL